MQIWKICQQLLLLHLSQTTTGAGTGPLLCVCACVCVWFFFFLFDPVAVVSCTGMNNILEKQVCCQLTCESSIWPWRSTKSCLSIKNQLFLQRNWSWSEPSLTLLLLSMVVYLRQMLETSTQLAPLLSFYTFICFHLTQ